MKWTDSLSVGIEQIDFQHKTLINAINELFDACSKGMGRKKITETLEFMKNYTVTHFKDEEEVQRKCGYPDFVNHKKIHDDFVKQVIVYSNRLETEGPNISLVVDFNKFVNSWLMEHISNEDKKIGQFINSKS